MNAPLLGIAIAVLGGALGQLLMKAGVQALPIGAFNAMLNSILFHHTSALLIIAGIFSYVVSMIVWVHTLKNHKLSQAYPILSLGYVIVYFAAAFWPGIQEAITVQKTLGIALIIIGVWISQPSTSTEEV